MTPGEASEPLTSLSAYERVFRARRRAGRAVVALVLVGGVWLVALDSDDADARTVTGVVVLEALTVALAVWAWVRHVRLDNLVDRMLAHEEQARAQVVRSMARLDDTLARLAGSAGGPAPLLDSVHRRRALDEAELAAPGWRALVIRRYDLGRRLVVETDERARAALEDGLGGCASVIAGPRAGVGRPRGHARTGAGSGPVDARRRPSPAPGGRRTSGVTGGHRRDRGARPLRTCSDTKTRLDQPRPGSGTRPGDVIPAAHLDSAVTRSCDGPRRLAAVAPREAVSPGWEPSWADDRRATMALIRRTLALVAIAVGAVLVAAGPAGAVPEHQHCITTPNGDTQAIAGGVTNEAPHDTAFHNFHGHVHMGAFATNPIPIAADLTEPYTCPPSP